MSLYLTRFSYTAETWSAMIEHPEDRRDRGPLVFAAFYDGSATKHPCGFAASAIQIISLNQ